MIADYQTCYLNGAQCHDEGYQREHNPYTECSLKARAWENGWDDAREADILVENGDDYHAKYRNIFSW